MAKVHERLLQACRDCDGSDGPPSDGLSCPDSESIRRVLPEDGAEAARGFQPESANYGNEFGKRWHSLQKHSLIIAASSSTVR